jgi:hypothetical protein
MLSANMQVFSGGVFPPYFGWAILPHGGGAYYNVFGNYIGTILPARNFGSNIGEYMPQDGEIYGGAINFALRDNGSGQTYNVYGTNYGSSTTPGVFPPAIQPINQVAPISSASPGNTQGSFSNWGLIPGGRPIPFAAGDYIGIFIDYTGVGGVPARGLIIDDPITIEGTLYVRFTNENTGRQGYINSDTWP